MNIKNSPINVLVIIEPTVFQDACGYFFEAFNLNTKSKTRFKYQFVTRQIVDFY